MVSVDVLIERVEEFLHLVVLELGSGRVGSLLSLLLLFFLGGNVDLVTLTKRFGQLEGVDDPAHTRVQYQDDTDGPGSGSAVEHRRPAVR